MREWKVFHPELFQGAKRKHKYFEGWYCKIALQKPTPEVLCLISGISLSSDSHAFIQVVSSLQEKSWYVRFPLSAFHAEKNRFIIHIGENSFSRDTVHISIKTDGLDLVGDFTFSEVKQFPVSFTRPGIMGWYAYVPRMECLHAVVATCCTARGQYVLNSRSVDIAEADGYMEKDWGTSFPKAYLWMQANSFSAKGVSVMLSIAHIPFHGLSFTGFLGFIQLPDSLISFGTYTGAKFHIDEVKPTNVQVTISTKAYRITLSASLGSASGLAAPKQGSMERTIYESVDGTMQLRLETNQGELLFDACSPHAGLEFSEASHLMDGR